MATEPNLAFCEYCEEYFADTSTPLEELVEPWFEHVKAEHPEFTL